MVMYAILFWESGEADIYGPFAAQDDAVEYAKDMADGRFALVFELMNAIPV